MNDIKRGPNELPTSPKENPAKNPFVERSKMEHTLIFLETDVETAIKEASNFCLGCQRKELWVWPPKSGIVAQAAVHSSGLICIPNTVKMLLRQKKTTLKEIMGKL